jgi:transposase-like protein
LDEMVVSIRGRRMYLWRAVDSEGEILDLLVQPKRDKAAALRLMRKLLKKQGYAPRVLVTDKLGSYGSARRQLGLTARQYRAASPAAGYALTDDCLREKALRVADDVLAIVRGRTSGSLR